MKQHTRVTGKIWERRHDNYKETTITIFITEVKRQCAKRREFYFHRNYLSNTKGIKLLSDIQTEGLSQRSEIYYHQALLIDEFQEEGK